MVKNAVLSMWLLYKDSHLARNNLFYNDFIFKLIKNAPDNAPKKKSDPPKKHFLALMCLQCLVTKI